MVKYEMMFDLETLDTTPSAVILSVGAVLWNTELTDTGHLHWHPIDRFLRVVNIQEQLDVGRTVSQSTLLWWQRQDENARAEAFAPVRRSCAEVMKDLMFFTSRWDRGINSFWASPTTFDFPIYDSFARQMGGEVPWRYNQLYDVRTVVNEASYSAKNHIFGDGGSNSPQGIPHTPVYDCEYQIDLLNAARNKIGRRIS
jgi:hypothetical protein